MTRKIKDSGHPTKLLLCLLTMACSVLSTFSCAQTPTTVRTSTLEVFDPLYHAQVSVSEAIIRESADASSAEMGRLPSGATVTVTARQGDWVRVETSGIMSSSGWIVADVLVFTQSKPIPQPSRTSTRRSTVLTVLSQPTPTPTLQPVGWPTPTCTPPSRPPAQCKVTVSSMNLYMYPDTSSRVLTAAVQGWILIPIAYSSDRDWVKVRTSRGVEGWVSTAFIDCSVSISSPLAPSPSTSGASVIVHSDVNVREGPGTAYPRLGTVTKGTVLKIVGKNSTGGWWQVCCVTGQRVWISGQLVDVEGNTDGIEVAVNIPSLPPTPTALPPPTPGQTPAPLPAVDFLLLARGECVSNPSETYFEGSVISLNGAPLDNVCVQIALDGEHSTKCSGCDGATDGSWRCSPFGGPAPSGTMVELYVVGCPVSMHPSGQIQETGCWGESIGVSEKWTYTVSESVECHGITFVRTW